MRFNKYGLDKAQTLSFQSLSPAVLENICRKNISLEHFRELMNEYSSLGISTSSELILGLAGETRESFTKGLCDLLEYGQHKAIQVYTCDLLVNSEMGSPEYIEKFGIETVRTQFSQAHCNASEHHEIQEYNTTVIKTNSLSVDDWIYCVVFACIIQAFHNIGFFRAIAIFLRNEYGISYHNIYSKIALFSQNPENKACHSVFSLIKNFAKGMSEGKNPWAVPCEGLGDICWQFDEIYFLKSLEKADAIYEELKTLIKSEYGDNGILDSLFDFQRNILKRCGADEKITIKSDYDFYSYLGGIYKGEYSSLEKLPTAITIDNSMPCKDLYEYACKVIWYGRNQSAALYTSDFYKPEIKYN